MQRFKHLHLLLPLVMLLTASPGTQAQGAQICFVDGGTELGFENESNLPVYVQVFEADGTPVLSYQGSSGVTVLPNEDSGSCDFGLDINPISGPTCIRSCQDGPDVGNDCGDDLSEYGGYRCFVPNELMRVVLRIEDITLFEDEREHFSFAYGSGSITQQSAGSFYTPFASTAQGNQDAHIRYYGMNGESKVLASVDPISGNFIEDFIGDTYVMPYNLDYVCAQPGANCSQPYSTHGVFLTPVPYTPPPSRNLTDGSLPPIYTFAPGTDVMVPDTYNWDWNVTDLQLNFPDDQKLIVEGAT